MSQTLLEYLQEQSADGGMIEQATRYYIAAKFPGITPPKMRKTIATSGVAADELGVKADAWRIHSRPSANPIRARNPSWQAGPEQQQRLGRVR